MGRKPASILTQTQRNRIRDEFEDLTEEETRRDQQRIRERVRSGILDFRLLLEYPDRQFDLAFDNTSDDELRAALADTYIVVERLRERRGIHKDELIEEARAHTETFADSEDTGTLERIDLRTATDVRRQTEDELAERFEPGRWDKRASGLMKLGVSAAIPFALLLLFDVLLVENITQSILSLPFWGFMFLVFMSATGWVSIKTAQSLKYNILPAAVNLIRNPEAMVRDIFRKLIKNPGETMRRSWDEL